MLYLIVYIFCLFLACAVAAKAAVSDFRGMTIPNAYVGVLPIIFFVAFGAVQLSDVTGIFMALSSHLWAAFIGFGLTFVMFALKMMGAGDAKLITGFSFWFGLQYLLAFFFYTAFAGGALGVFALVVKKKKPFKSLKEGSWLARLQSGEAVVPYGIAISAGAVFGFVRAGYFSPDTLTMFLGG